MDANFWHNKWQKNEIGFHEQSVNPALAGHFESLGLEQGDRVFVPLCGKTLDIAWLLESGFSVVGAELSEMAIQQLFAEMGVEPTITEEGTLKRYSSEHLDILVGDIFDLSRDQLGQIAAIYDRAALVALPEETRVRYANHLVELSDRATQLVVCYEYDQSQMAGPPFSISSDELMRLYSGHYTLELLESKSVEGGIRREGKSAATENIWLLS